MSRVAIGVAVCIVLGVLLGVGLGPLASSLSARTISSTPFNAVDPSQVTVEEAAGEVEVSEGGLAWRRLTEGETLSRPLSIRTAGLEGFVRVAVKGAQLVIAHDAEVHLGARGKGLAFQVDRGLVLAHRQKQPVHAMVPQRELDVTGQTFGIWVRRDRVVLAVLANQTQVRHRDDEPRTYSFGREVTVIGGGLEPAVLPSKLEMDVITKRKVGRLSRIAGRTWPSASVLAFGRNGFEPVDLTRGGTFAVQVPGDMPAPGTLISLDAAGRWAEFGAPSRRLEQVVHDLQAGRARRAPRVAPDPSAVDAAPPVRDGRQARNESASAGDDREDDRAEERSRRRRNNREARRSSDDGPKPEPPPPPPPKKRRKNAPSVPSIDEFEDEELDETAL